MSELVTWLRAQLDEDEQWAQNMLRPPADWRAAGVNEAIVAGLARRQLAEVEAKRLLLGEYDLAMAERRAHPKDLANAGWWLGTLRMLKLLALPYADRPGYQQEWSPSA